MKRQVITQKSFARLQKLVCKALHSVCTLKYVSLVFFLFCLSCGTKNEPENEPELICETLSGEPEKFIACNLSKNGEFDPELVIGEWVPIKFAYTDDGILISDIADISANNKVIIEKSKGNEMLWSIKINDCRYDISLADNLFKSVSIHYPSFLVWEEPSFTDDEQKMLQFFKCAYSFVVKNNELIIHFAGEFVDDINSEYFCPDVVVENLVILKKR